MAFLVSAATAAMTVTAAVILAIAVHAWRTSGNRRVLLLSGGFLLFLAKGVILSVGLFLLPRWGDILLPVSVLVDLGILGLFYVAILAG